MFVKELQAKQHEDKIVDDEPPLLLDEEDADDRKNNQIEQQQQQEEPSLMDEMVAIAQRAKAEARRRQEKERSSESFGQGLKKGFFNTPKPATRSNVSNQKQTSKTQKKMATRDDLLIVKQQHEPEQSREQDATASSFVFPEVQDALKSMNQLDPKAWMNAKFFEKLAKHPHLALALQNPRFTQAIEDLQRDPQSAVLKYRKDEAVSKMLQDFLGFLSSHFEELGKEQEAAMKKQQAQQDSQQQPSSLLVQPSKPSSVSTSQAKAASTQPSIVDMDEVRREAIANMARSPDEEAQVQRILKNPELLQALSDAELMQRLQGCRECPRELRRLQEDPTLGPKLQLLVDAHLVTFQ